MNKVIKCFFLIVIIVFVIVIFFMYQILNIPIRQTKDYSEIYIEQGEVVDGDVIISPPEKYSELLQINLSMRKRVAEYMDKNNYKLKSGRQKFVRNNPSFEELVKDGFVFERHSDGSPVLK